MMNRHSLLKYTADIRSVCMVVLAFGLSLVPFIITMPLASVLCLLPAVFLARTHAPFAQHNHGHLAAFNSGFANWLYDLLLAQCTGYPTALWELHHTRGHHRHFLTPEKDVARLSYLSTGERMSRWMYAIRGNLLIHWDSVKIGLQERREGKKSLLGKLALETVQQIVITALLVAWNPWLAVTCFIVPNIVCAWFVWWTSYKHHLDVPGTSIYDGSVTILDNTYNFHAFNIGHHTAHHEKPTLHWSLLPERTEQIRSKVPAECIVLS